VFSVPSGGAAAENIVAEAGKAASDVEAESTRVYIEDTAIVAIEKKADDVGVGSNVAIDAIAIEEVGAMTVGTAASSRVLVKKEVKEDISMSGGYMCNHLQVGQVVEKL
jgi:hypothetical protein